MHMCMDMCMDVYIDIRYVAHGTVGTALDVDGSK